MSPAPEPTDLKEVAKILGVSERTAYRLINEPDFPSPTRVGNTRIWDASEVKAWKARTPAPRRGRPPKSA